MAMDNVNQPARFPQRERLRDTGNPTDKMNPPTKITYANQGKFASACKTMCTNCVLGLVVVLADITVFRKIESDW
jgi:hypothetical protein